MNKQPSGDSSLITSKAHMKTEKPIIEKLIEHVVSECSAIDIEKRYNDTLNEIYSFESVGGPFEHMQPSDVLKEMDPTAYRCGMADWSDGESYTEIGSDYYDQDEVEKARDSFLDELDSQISDLESEIEDAESEEDANVSEIASQKRQLAELQSDYQAVKNHTF